MTKPLPDSDKEPWWTLLLETLLDLFFGFLRLLVRLLKVVSILAFIGVFLYLVVEFPEWVGTTAALLHAEILAVVLVTVFLVRRNHKQLLVTSGLTQDLSAELFKVKMTLKDTEKRVVGIGNKVEALEWKLLSDEDREQYEIYAEQQRHLGLKIEKYRDIFKELEKELKKDEQMPLYEKEDELWQSEKEREFGMDFHGDPFSDGADFELRRHIEKMTSAKEFVDYVKLHEFSGDGNGAITWELDLKHIDEKRIQKAMFQICWMYDHWQGLRKKKESTLGNAQNS